jgi:sn-glycerol 3-phosphate transport system substrate-binding protein
MPTRRTLLAAAAASLAAPAIARAQTVKRLTFYYPIAVGGPIQAIIDGYCRDFRAETGIEVAPVYAGDYSSTLMKATAAIHGGQGPQFAVLLAAEIHSLQGSDLIVPLDEVGLDAGAKAWLGGFWPALMANSQTGGKIWSVPFQRSTAIMFYNKASFTKAGLDPEHFPQTWAEFETVAQKLTQRDASGRVTQWGFKCASDLGNAQWTFTAMANQAGGTLMNQAGTETYFDRPPATDAMTYWHDFAARLGASPPGETAWPTLSPDFLHGNAAVIQHTTGNLTNVRDQARFPFGVALLPGKTAPRTVTGGGNIYILKNASAAERQAALRFARWVSTPARAADWSIRTGYVATRPDAYDTPALRDYIAKFPPAAVGKDGLPIATGELSTYENQRIYKALTDNIQAVLNGAKPPQRAMADTQATATRILRPWRHA